MRQPGILITLAAGLAALAAVPAAAQTATGIAVRDNLYSPAALRIEPGTRVVWTNEGNADHTVTASDGSFDSFTLAPGDTYARVFDGTGTVRYYCRFHGDSGGGGMAGTLRIGGVDAADGGGARVEDRRARRDPDLATTGARDLPYGALAFLALTIVALGAWLSSWERIVFREAFRRR